MKPGLFLSQGGQGKEDTEEHRVMDRTESVTDQVRSGHSKSTKSAHKEHKISTEKTALPSDLERIIELWPSLPEPVRTSIMTLVEASVKKE